MTWLLVLAIGAGVAAVVVTLAAAHSTLQAQRQYERLLEQVPKAAHLADLEQRIADRRTEVEKLSGQVAEHERLRQLIPGLERAVADLEKKKATLAPVEELYARLGEQVQQRQREYSELVNKLERSEAQLQDQLGKLQDAQRTTDSERLAAVTARSEADAARIESKRLQGEIEDQRGQLADLQDRLEEERSALRTAQSERDAALTKVRELRVERSELETQLQPLRAQKLALVQDIRGFEQTLKQLQDRQHALDAAVAGLEAKRRGLEQTLESLHAREATAMQAVAEARTQLATVTQELNAAREKQGQLRAEMAQLESALVPLREARAAMQREVKALESELQRQRERQLQLEEQLAGLLAQKAQLEEAIKQLERRRKEIEGETEKLLSGFIEHGKAMTGGFDFVDAFEAVCERVLPATERLRSSLNESQALEEVKQHARDLGFVYSDRVIRSFHTSLKLGGQSPLLVLAGISGTGKSQLPRIYCDALGINFLSMAVQPGWDSPADLLGFFSHIERRFKPTPLARALLQMDPHAMETLKQLDGYDKGRGKAFRDGIEAHHDEVLMVLLDEMNLARIEYYFSDFLSKLETRNSRGFKEADAVSRARAEVLLEAPNARGGLQALPLFAGKNVLFVGTMNEDESTMALSDKVIDRANVLRFGRPAKLETKPGKAKDARVDRLGKGVWNSWCTSTTALETREAEVKRIRAWIDLINEGMDQAHRPFAYRTDQAIQAYCLGYPRESLSSDVALRMAFADQIEQRIMPKLRGLDLQEEGGRAALGAVQQVVAELKDDELAEAIERGKRANGGSSFAWYGVTRSEKGAAAIR